MNPMKTAALVLCATFFCAYVSPSAEQPPTRERARQEAELAMSHRILDRAIGIAEDNVKAYEELTATHAALQERLAALMTSDEGKRVAATLDPVLSREVVQHIDAPLLDLSVLDANHKQATGIIKQLKKERDSIVPGYVPPEALINEMQSLGTWARQAQVNVKLRNDWIEQRLSIAAPEFDPISAPTLAAVLAEYNRREQQAWSAARKQGKDQATSEGQGAISEAARISELEKMLQQSRQLLDQSRSALLTQKGDHDAAVARQKEQYEQNMADLRRELATGQANRLAQDAQTENIGRQGQIDAEKLTLEQEAKDPALQKLLAPLLAKGFSQPGQKDRSLEAKPVSLSLLRAVGALERSEDGLFQLAKVATPKLAGKGRTQNNKDWDRPTWGYPNSWKDWTNEQRQELLRAQDALNRLGPTMVKLSLLAP